MADYARELLENAELAALKHQELVRHLSEIKSIDNAFTALHEVLNLHQPLRLGHWPDVCAVCQVNGDAALYPCSTVRAITDALEKSNG